MESKVLRKLLFFQITFNEQDKIFLPKSIQSASRLIRLMGNQQVPNITTIAMSILLVLLVLASSSCLFLADLLIKRNKKKIYMVSHKMLFCTVDEREVHH